MAYRKLGRTKEALDAHKQALEKHRQQDDKSGEASCRHAMALVYEEMNQPEKAIAFYEWALAIRREVVDRPGEAITCYNLSKLNAKINHLVEAEALLARCVEIEEQTGHADLTKDEAELAELRERRRRAGLPAPSGDTSGKLTRIARDDPYADKSSPLDLTQRSRPVRRD
jgi:tetratricopeptide (TPR) repeat protein